MREAQNAGNSFDSPESFMALSVTRSWRFGLLISAIAVTYFLSAKFAFSLVRLGTNAESSALYPPAGISLAALLLFGRPAWIGVALGALLFARSLSGISWVTVIGATLGSTLEAVSGEFLLQRVGFHRSLRRLQDVFVFVTIGAAFSSAVNATISTFNGYFAELVPGQALLDHWWTVWLGDDVGILVVTPVLLTWFSQPPQRRPSFAALVKAWRENRSFRRRSVEVLLWLSLLIVCAWVVLRSPVLPGQNPSGLARHLLHYLPFLVLGWAALRLGQRGTVLSSLIFSAIAIWGVVQDRGWMQIAGDSQQAIYRVQAFVGVTTVMALMLAAAIAERQQAEDLLRRQEASLTNAQRVAQIGNWDWDESPCSTQITLSWSDELYRILGFVPRSLPPSQENFLLRVHRDDREQVRQALERARSLRVTRQGSLHKPDRLCYRIVLTNGSERTVSEQVEVNGMTITGTVQDITEQQRLSERDRLLNEITLQLRQSLKMEEILNTTVEEVRQFLGIDRVFFSQFDQRGYTRVVAESVDPTWRSVLGTESPMSILEDVRAIFGQSHIRVNHDSAQVERTPFINAYYEQYQIRASIAIAILQDGQLFGVLNVNQCSEPRHWQAFEIELLEKLATQVEIAIQQGILYQQVQTLADNLEHQVTERTLQLQQNMEQLQAANQMKDTLLHAVTHDLKTPMLGMLMVLRRLQTRPDQEIFLSRSVLDCMVESSEHQISLIRSLSEVDSLETQEIALDRQPFQFSDLVRSVLQDLHPLLIENDAQLNTLIPKNLPLVVADSINIRRVLENLITNALKHNRPGLKITIAAEVRDEMLRCTIADDGVGMSQEQCAQVFKKPYLRGFHNRHLTGLGLGLFWCHQSITAHQGQIGVISSPNLGATVWFTLPLPEVI
jgi:signal transduction histidine kinase/integral membrane sensor domain MASE1